MGWRFLKSIESPFEPIREDVVSLSTQMVLNETQRPVELSQEAHGLDESDRLFALADSQVPGWVKDAVADRFRTDDERKLEQETSRLARKAKDIASGRR